MVKTLALLALFVAVFVGVEWLLLGWRSRFSADARRLSRRMEMIAGAEAASTVRDSVNLKQRGGDVWWSRLRERMPSLARLDDWIEQSGLSLNTGSLLRMTVVTVLLGGLAGGLLGRGGGVLWAALAGCLPVLFVWRTRRKRLRRFEQQLPDCLDLVGRALRAGHALPAALQMAGDEMPAPAGEVFARICDEIRFGQATHSALQNLANRVPLTDVKFFVIAMLIQRETGGNLAEVLGGISQLIRERIKLFGRVRALSAEGRFSGLVLLALPFAKGGMLYAIDGEFMSLLWRDETGLFLLRGAVAMMLLGAVWMRSIINIRV